MDKETRTGRRPRADAKRTLASSAGRLDDAQGRSHWDRRRIAIARRIEKAALQLFLKRHPDEVTVEEIAEAAGISRRTFFRYFQSRDDILAAAPSRALAETIQLVSSRPPEESIAQAFIAASRDSVVPDDEAELRELSGDVMIRAPDCWQRALGRLRGPTHEIFAKAVSERLKLAGKSVEGAGIIGICLASTLVYIYIRWVEGGRRGDLSKHFEKGLRHLDEIWRSRA